MFRFLREPKHVRASVVIFLNSFNISMILEYCASVGTIKSVYDGGVETVPDTNNMRRVYIICNVIS